MRLKNKLDIQITVLSSMFILLAIGFVINEIGTGNMITGAVVTSDITTYVSLSGYFSINASENLTTDGIRFFINTLPSINKSAHGNANGAAPNGTNTYLTVESDSNVNVKFCIKANDSLRFSNSVIDTTNYFWADSTAANNATLPHLNNVGPAAGAVNITNMSVDASTLAPGGSDYFRFWLSVPGAQTPGTYINQINFKGVQTGNLC
jgi:hypothetical protein